MAYPCTVFADNVLLDGRSVHREAVFKITDLHGLPQQYLEPYLRYIPYQVAASLLVFGLLRLYKSIWRFASYNELLRVILASLVTLFIHLTGMVAS